MSWRDMVGISWQDMVGTAIIIFTLTIVGAVLAWSEGEAEGASAHIDPQTLCSDTIPAHTVLLVDRSDRFSGEQWATVRSEIERVREKLRANERFSIFPIRATAPQNPKPYFSKCRPRDGGQAHWFNENSKMMREGFEGVFSQPLDAILTELEAPENAPRSAIFETIKAVAHLPSFSPAVPNRILIIVSDFLQNVPSFSMYKQLPSYKEFRVTAYAQTVIVPLEGVTVIVFYLSNEKAPAYQGHAHLDFWIRWFQEMGATVKQGRASS